MQKEIELQAQGVYEKMCEEAHKENYQLEVMLDYESHLPKISSEMAYWWWDNMGPIDRYRMWSSDHLAFEWEIDPSVNGHIGAIHCVTEYVGDIPVVLRLRYEDPKKYPGTRKYKHHIVESVLTRDNQIMGWVLHEFEDVEKGLVMRNVFHLVVGTSPEIINGIKKHSEAEMNKLPKFLPSLYAECKKGG